MCSFRVFLLLALSSQGRLTLADVNVYGQSMTSCGSDHAGGCTYVAGDQGAHEVCVTKLPHGFSSDTGQGPWSDEFAGKPWCVCIWAYSNYILQKKDLPLKCKSIPSKVLEEKYSLDRFKECGSMASAQGCGGEDIRRSIESLCNQCKQQAEDEESKNVLKAKCKSILASAPAASLAKLYSEEVSNAKGFLSFDDKLGMPRFTSGVFLFAIAGVFVGISRRFSGNRQQTTEGQPATQDSSAGDFDREALLEA